MTEKPLLSVVMITYGHEKYVEEAIKGVLMQKTDFPFEFIIANDCSPDNSDEIIKKAIENVPENITVKYNRHRQNLGMMPNFIWALEQTTGKFIALCEGDDYWTDEKKLQIQADFLQDNQNCSLIFHGSKVVFEEGIDTAAVPFQGLETRYYQQKEMLNSWLIPTASAFFRSSSIKVAIKRLKNPNYCFGDIVLFLSLAQEGDLYCISAQMSTYRINAGGETKKFPTNNKYEKIAKHLDALSNDFDGKFKSYFKPRVKNIYFNLLKLNIKKANKSTFFYLIKYLENLKWKS